MTTRRKFLQVAACALPAATGGWRSAAAAVPPGRRLATIHAVLVDERLAAARTFGQRFKSRGATVLSIAAGDITEPWLGVIRPAWAQGPAVIAGLTAPSALFCLEQLAWSHGLRVVFHAEHIVHRDGTTLHQLQRGGTSVDLGAMALLGAGTQWPAALADAISARRAPPARRLGPSIAALEPALPPGAQLLTSWIIAAA